MKSSMLRVVCMSALVGLLLGLAGVPSQAAVASAPTVSGRAEIGQTLTAAPATPSPAGLSFQWYADDVPIAGATRAMFTITPAQADRALSVESIDMGAAPSERSLPTRRVMRVATPRIEGTLAVGSTLRVQRGSWSAGSSAAYQWYAGATKISGATSSSLKLTSAHGAKAIRVLTTGRAPGYQEASRSSLSTAKVFTAAAKPRITGKRAAGRTLTAERGTWMKNARISYRWYADGQALSKATRSTLKVPSSAVNKKITVQVTGSRSGYATVTKSSSGTAKIQRIGTPRLSGSATVGKTVRVSPGTWTSGTKFRYQWYLNGKRISGATKTTVKVKYAWRGKRLSARVKGTRSGYSTFNPSTKRSAKIRVPERTAPASLTTCPSWAPIKGNADSGIYHVRGQRFYDATHPEECFRTESAARAAGYRKAKV